ncbi:iron complex transport system substrate-binding protein [Paenibacillus sp. UNCCL117]|uniref:ABC transporter substrate-binding protein n=1 Tax=unclassified Paenibacillus TaxID=185978 RepID=UPI00088E99E0|nr:MULTISPECIES: ABC transporter substrate-binding protein [unclassified Paenibacillus]SDE60581.1 iron complex transport system substrate-binding protein [Paenibacillus sp. cl123]SFW69574.1 iron complex transport system substrate-binding protein [Paenibacillus sp. UNCCL117]
MMNKAAWLSSALALLLVAGCSQSPGAGDGAPAAAARAQAVTVQDFAGRSVVFNQAPRSIVALSSGELDIVYALGAEVTGRPTSASPVPVKDAEKAVQVGTAHGIDLEKIALLSPDVVLGNYPMNAKDIPSLEALGSKVVLSSANSIDDIKKQIQLLGQLLQREAKAAELIKRLDDKLLALAPKDGAARPRVLLVYGAPGTYMAALNNSLSGDLLVKAGGDNIAADYPKLESYPQYAQLNTEKIVQSNPQLVLLMSHANPDQVKDGFMKEMEQNAAWSSLDAVKNKRVEVLPADLFGTNPGTRVIEALELLGKLLQTVK